MAKCPDCNKDGLILKWHWGEHAKRLWCEATKRWHDCRHRNPEGDWKQEMKLQRKWREQMR